MTTSRQSIPDAMSRSDDAPTDEQLRVAIRSWLATHARQVDASDDRVRRDANLADVVPEARAAQRSLFDAGLAGLTWPSKYGGRSLGPEQQQIWNDEASTYELPQARVLAVGLGMCGPTILQLGTDMQRERFIRPLLRADELWCQLFSEPGAGSDVAGLQMRAERDGDDWVLSGQKVWTSGAHYADYGVVIARTDPTVPKHHGITMFIVDMRAPGIEIRPLRQINGSSNFNEVFFDGVRIAHEHVIGEPGSGWRAAVTMLANERVAIGASGARARVSVDDVLPLASERGVADDPVMRQRLVDLYIREKIVELIGMRVRASQRSGAVPGPEASIAKLIGSQLSRDRADVAAEIAGPAAVAWPVDAPAGDRWADFVLSAPGSAIAGGTDQIQRNIIGERVLGLPKEPQLDRDLPFDQVAKGV